MGPSAPPLPLRGFASLLAGYAVVAGLALLLPWDPLAALPASPPPGAATLPAGWDRAPAAGVGRIAIVGASETIGFPYGKEIAFASQLEVGLQALGRRVECAAFGGTALDGPRIAALARTVLATGHPSQLVVVLGGNELSGRVFAGRAFWPDSPVARSVDVASRARLLFMASAATEHATDDVDVQAALLRKVYEARPGRPALGGLPVGPRDRLALEERLARTIDALVADVQRSGCSLVLAIAPHDRHGTAPYGVLAQDLADPVARRDADPAPMHRTSAIAAVIADRAKALGIPCVDLEAALAGARQPDPARFLDALHPDAEGHSALAAYLAPHLVTGLPEGWEGTFAAALRTHLATRLDAEQRRAARLQAGWSDALLHLLCGNFAGALAPVERNLAELEGAPAALRERQLQDLGGYVLLTVFGLAGRIDAEQPRAAAHLRELGEALAKRESKAWLARWRRSP